MLAQGPDATPFLHGQLTQDFALLGPHSARLAGYCSPKGRLLASFIGWKSGAQADSVFLACSADLLGANLKRLSMFVMRAQCKLTDVSTTHALWGVVGAPAHALASQHGLSADTWCKAELHPGLLGMNQEAAPGDAATSDLPATLVRLPPATDDLGHTVDRLLVCAPAAWSAPNSQAISLAEWQYLEVRSGVATVTLPLADALVPQMLNYESVGGVSFKKGCYPGQEVVARSQFRGSLKRRTYRLTSPTPLAVGAELFHSSDAEQPCGTVVSAAPHPSGNGWELLASLQVAATQSGSVHAHAPDVSSRVVLTLGTLPYALMEDI